MKKDLRTVKFYTFSLEQRRLHPVGLEVDIFPSQRVEDFAVLDQALTDISLPLLLALISGSLLLFSMQTGQIIRKVTEEALTSVHLVKAILPIHGGASFYAVSDSSLHEIILVDNNTEGSKQDIKLALSTTSKKRLK